MYLTKNNISAFLRAQIAQLLLGHSSGGSSHLILLSTSLLVVLEDVVPDVVLGVDEELLGVALLLPPLHPHHEQQDHGCKGSRLGQLPLHSLTSPARCREPHQT